MNKLIIVCTIFVVSFCTSVTRAEDKGNLDAILRDLKTTKFDTRLKALDQLQDVIVRGELDEKNIDWQELLNDIWREDIYGNSSDNFTRRRQIASRQALLVTSISQLRINKSNEFVLELLDSLLQNKFNRTVREAITQIIANVPSVAVGELLLDKSIQDVRNEVKDSPYLDILKNSNWRAVPIFLTYLEKERNPTEINEAAAIFNKVITPKIGIEILNWELTVRERELADLPNTAPGGNAIVSSDIPDIERERLLVQKHGIAELLRAIKANCE